MRIGVAILDQELLYGDSTALMKKTPTQPSHPPPPHLLPKPCPKWKPRPLLIKSFAVRHLLAKTLLEGKKEDPQPTITLPGRVPKTRPEPPLPQPKPRAEPTPEPTPAPSSLRIFPLGEMQRLHQPTEPMHVPTPGSRRSRPSRQQGRQHRTRRRRQRWYCTRR